VQLNRTIYCLQDTKTDILSRTGEHLSTIGSSICDPMYTASTAVFDDNIFTMFSSETVWRFDPNSQQNTKIEASLTDYPRFKSYKETYTNNEISRRL